MADKTVVRFGRQYSFTAAHRLYSDTLGEDKSRDLYGKCSNPAGHGHNYKVTAVIEGTPDPVTGMILNMTILDGIADRILASFAYKHLDRELSEFAERPSTAEHIAQALYDKFSQQLAQYAGVVVQRLEISETRNNSCSLTLVSRAA